MEISADGKTWNKDGEPPYKGSLSATEDGKVTWMGYEGQKSYVYKPDGTHSVITEQAEWDYNSAAKLAHVDAIERTAGGKDVPISIQYNDTGIATTMEKGTGAHHETWKSSDGKKWTEQSTGASSEFQITVNDDGTVIFGPPKAHEPPANRPQPPPYYEKPMGP